MLLSAMKVLPSCFQVLPVKPWLRSKTRMSLRSAAFCCRLSLSRLVCLNPSSPTPYFVRIRSIDSACSMSGSLLMITSAS